MFEILTGTLFPLGIWTYLVGGILIGLSVLIMYIPTGSIPGASRILHAVLSVVSTKVDGNFRKHRLVYGGGILLGAVLFTLLLGSAWKTQVAWWRLLIGGFFIGLGASMGRGCTSGHGVCGLASIAKSSIIFVLVFLIVGIITATSLAALGLGVTS